MPSRHRPCFSIVGRFVQMRIPGCRRLYEFGEYDWDTFMAKRAQIQQEQQRLRNETAAAPNVHDAEWCRAQILDLLAACEAADDRQRSRLLGSLFESIEADALPDRRLKLTAIPRGGWRRFFQEWYWSGRRGSNSQLQPWEGDGPFLYSGTRENLSRCLSTPIFERDHMAFASHHRTINWSGRWPSEPRSLGFCTPTARRTHPCAPRAPRQVVLLRRVSTPPFVSAKPGRAHRPLWTG
jgi:hypothetical protein